jgi:hypothetical protein
MSTERKNMTKVLEDPPVSVRVIKAHMGGSTWRSVGDTYNVAKEQCERLTRSGHAALVGGAVDINAFVLEEKAVPAPVRDMNGPTVILRVVQSGKSIGGPSQEGPSTTLVAGHLLCQGDTVELPERVAIGEIQRGSCELVLGQQLTSRGRDYFEGKTRNY